MRRRARGDATWQGYVAARRQESRDPKAPAKVEERPQGPAKRVSAQSEWVPAVKHARAL
jgi:hypothetical protein